MEGGGGGVGSCHMLSCDVCVLVNSQGHLANPGVWVTCVRLHISSSFMSHRVHVPTMK